MSAATLWEAEGREGMGLPEEDAFEQVEAQHEAGEERVCYLRCRW